MYFATQIKQTAKTLDGRTKQYTADSLTDLRFAWESIRRDFAAGLIGRDEMYRVGRALTDDLYFETRQLIEEQHDEQLRCVAMKEPEPKPSPVGATA